MVLTFTGTQHDLGGAKNHLDAELSNGQFEGRATAETFRGSGSTDILFVENDRSVFIAECKFWKGPASLTGTLEQLLDYATWRDAKAALLIFSRNKDFSQVLAEVPETLENSRRKQVQSRGSLTAYFG